MRKPGANRSRIPRLIVTTLVFGVVASTFVLYVRAERKVDRASEERLRSLRLADELRHSSESLTNLARSYVVIGDPASKRNYHHLLDVRDGRKPRRDRHLYDMDQSAYGGSPPPVEAGTGVPLMELLQRAALGEREYGLLALAKRNADLVVETEIGAMRLFESGGPEAAARRERGRQMLFDDAYGRAKRGILGPIAEFSDLLDARTAAAVDQALLHAAAFRFAFVGAGLFWLLLLWRGHASLRALLGASPDEVHAQIARLGQGDFSATAAPAPGGADSVTAWLGETRQRLADLTVSRDRATGELIRERESTEVAIRQMAFYDRLTNLPNRRLLEDRLVQVLARAQRERRRAALLYVDLDRFKPINDELGHAAGDWLLQRVGERMRKCLRASDTVARIGGDEFVVLVPDVDAVHDSMRVAAKIRASLREPFVTDEGRTLAISASIGVALYPDHAGSPRDLLRIGDEAMYRAKKGGRDAVELFAGRPELPEEGRALIRLAWTSAYACGEPTIDREHQELFRRANVVLDLVTRRDSEREQIAEAFDALLAHVSEHFAHEEGILRARSYAGVDEHVAAHRALLAKARDLRRLNEEARAPMCTIIEFVARDVVAGHTLGEDRKFRGLFEDSAKRGSG